MRKQLKKLALGVAGLVMAGVPAANADLVTLSDFNATATFAPHAGGMVEWSVNGTNHLHRQWFWYSMKIGDDPWTAAATIDTLELAGGHVPIDTNFLDDSAPDQLSLSYGPGAAGITVSSLFTLRGDGSGALNSHLTESITITNETGGTIGLRLYQYADFNLGGTPLDRSVDISLLPSGAGAVQENFWSVLLSESVVGPAPVHFEAATLAGGLPAHLDDSGNLGDTPSVAGPANLIWAFQWEETMLADGGNITIDKDKFLVPAPGGALLGLMGMGMVGLIRRRFV